MADRPIAFSKPMVLALLEGRKTQTRRIIALASGDAPAKPPSIFVGDCLYVREETHCWFSEGRNRYLRYAADQKATFIPWPDEWTDAPHRPMHCFKKWSRMTLPVTEVRVQRLQDISEEDARAEGAKYVQREELPGHFQDVWHHGQNLTFTDGFVSAIDSYRHLWNSINAKPGRRWQDNPFVAAYTFTVHHTNIERMPT